MMYAQHDETLERQALTTVSTPRLRCQVLGCRFSKPSGTKDISFAFKLIEFCAESLADSGNTSTLKRRTCRKSSMRCVKSSMMCNLIIKEKPKL